jgi:integrase
MEIPPLLKEELENEIPVHHEESRPHYTKDIRHIVANEEAEAMISRAKNPRDRAIIATLYLTGCRPIELVRLKRDDFQEIFEGGLKVVLFTAKLGQRKGFYIDHRALLLGKNSAFLDHIKNYVLSFPPGQIVFPISEVRVRQIVYELSLNEFCPYHFRHSRMTKLARAGWTIDQLMYWKGGSSSRSVDAYIRGKPIESVSNLD